MPGLRAHLIRSALIAVLVAVAVITQAEVIGRYLPRLVAGDGDAMVPLAIALGIVGVARGLMRYATEVSAGTAATEARRSLTFAVLDHVATLDEQGMAEAPPPRVAALVTSGVDALDPWIRTYLPALCLAVVVPLAAGARILVADPLSALILAIAIPLIPVFMVLIGQLTQERTDRQWAVLQRLAGHFHDVLVGLTTLRLFGREGAQVIQVRAIAEQYRLAVMRTLRVAFLSALALELLATLSVALVAVQVGVRLAGGHMALGTALVVLLLAPECSLPIRRVGAAYHASVTGMDVSAEVAELLDLTGTVDGPVDTVPGGPLCIRHALVVDPVRGHRVGPVDLTVAPGEVVALVGPSGAGKSTLLDAVRGRVRLDGGEITIAGVPVSELRREARTAALAWIPQVPAPLGQDVVASAGLGADAGSSAEVDRSLDALGLAPLAGRAPDQLSGGELQRLAVARALVRARSGQVRFLLADEPTAHLDPALVERVAHELRAVAATGVGVLVITHDHRLTDVADRVVAIPLDVAEPGTADLALDVAAPPLHLLPDRPARLATIGLALPDPAPEPVSRSGDNGSGPLGDLAWFRHIGRNERSRLMAARALGAAAEACTVGLAVTATWLIVRAAEQPSFVDLAVAAVAVRAFGLGKGVLRYWERLASHDATFRLLTDVRGAVVERLGQVVPAGVANLSRGDVMARVVDDVDRLADLELRVVGPTVSTLAVAAVVVVGATIASPPAGLVLGVAVLVGGVLLPGAALAASTRIGPALVSCTSSVGGTTLDLVEHLDEIVANQATAHWTDPVRLGVDRLAEIERSRGRRLGLVGGASTGLAAISAAAVALTTGHVGDRLSGPVTGVLVLLPFALMEMLVPLVQSGELFATVAASASRLRAVLATPDPVSEPAEPAPVPSRSSLALHRVGLVWPGSIEEVVHELDLDVAEGERLAVDGPSGSGKSTVAAALVRFIAPTQGDYQLGGTDTGRLGGTVVRRVVTWCPQSPWLADTSLRENLRIADPEVGEAAMWHVLDRVRMSEWAHRLPDGLGTMLGPNGATVSGGQRQRLALARVLLAGHRVVVLDEPTAHLDPVTAQAVLDDLLESLGDRTVILLGHGDGPAPAGFRSVTLQDGRLRTPARS